MNEIICRSCHKANAPGSKFCSHCGTRMPPTTKIICPSCQTPNARNLYYCDKCGTRLIQEESKPPSNKPTSTNELTAPVAPPKVFSLPTRKPGQTGELDPNTLPEWLRTGGEQEGAAPQKPPAERADKPKDLEDLPDWLVQKHDTPAQLFEPPKDITTDAFLEMLEQAETSGPKLDTNELLSQVSSQPGAPNLPDWLADAVKKTKEPAPLSNTPIQQVQNPLFLTEGAEIPDWLAELNPEYASQKASTPPAKPAQEPFPDWLNQPPSSLENMGQGNAPVSQEDDFGGFDWLEEPAPALKAPATPPPAKPEKSDFSLAEFADEEPPDWLSEVGPVDTDFLTPLPETLPATPATNTPSDLSDWFAEDDSPAESVAAGTPSLSQPPAEDWLGELEPAQTSELSSSSATMPVQPTNAPTKPSKEEALPDWLAELGPPKTGQLHFTEPEEPDSDWLTPEPTAPANSAMDSWLMDDEDEPPTAVASAVSSASNDDFDNWFVQETETPPTTDKEAETAPETLPDWLMAEDDDAPATAVAPATVSDVDGDDDDDFDSWFTQTETTPATDNVAESPSEAMADWLMDDEPATAVAPANPDGAAWLEAETPKGPHEPSATPSSSSDGDDFDWLQAGEETARVAPTAATAVPDWLSDLDEPLADTPSPSPEPSAGVPDWLSGFDEDELDSPAEPTSKATPSNKSLGFTALFGDMAQTPVEDPPDGADLEAVDNSWLTNFAEDDDQSDTGTLVEELFGEEAKPDTGDLGWLLDDLPSTDAGLKIEPTPAKHPAAASHFAADTADNNLPDWLADLGNEDEGTTPATAVSSQPPAMTPQSEPSHFFLSDSDDSDETDEPHFGEEASLEPDSGDLPDWLKQLGPPVHQSTPGPEIETAEKADLPAWLTNLRPDSNRSGTDGLKSVNRLPDAFSDTLEGIPEELAGASLPEWLQDISGLNTPAATRRTDENIDIPDWLRSESGSVLGPQTEELSASSGAEWIELLRDAAPAPNLSKELVPAEIPEWLDALKPKEPAKGEKRAILADQPLQKAGPLAGLRGVIEIAPTIALPRTSAPLFNEFTVTPEQKQHAIWLHQLATAEKAVNEGQEIHEGQRSSWLTRLVLALVILGTLLAGLLGPSLLKKEVSDPTALEAWQTAVESANGKKVLVAFEYTPAMAGEMNILADALLTDLQKRGKTIVTISQHPAGTAFADAYAEQFKGESLHFLPGEAVGLRQLVLCFQISRCNIAGNDVALKDVGLVVILTADRNSLLNWVEQVSATSNKPLFAAVSQSLAPLASPYWSNGQLAGVASGIPSARSFTEDDRGLKLLNAQVLGQLVTAVVLSLGMVLGFTGGFMDKRRTPKKKPRSQATPPQPSQESENSNADSFLEDETEDE